MTRLVYQPAFDPYNTSFRFLELRSAVWTKDEVEFDLVRITDFYLLFPFLIEKIRLKPSHKKYKKLAHSKIGAKPYARLPEESVLLNTMKPFQVAAANKIVDAQLADAEAWGHGNMLATDTQPPDELKQAIDAKKVEQRDLLEFLSVLQNEYDFLGENGLKHRTGLLEYRYDTV